MKTSDREFAPSYNMQVVTGAHLVADMRVTQDANDKYQLLPGMEGLASRWRQRPKHFVADGDFTTNLSMSQMAEHEIDFFGSGILGRQRNSVLSRTDVVSILSSRGTLFAMTLRRITTFTLRANRWFSEKPINSRMAARIASISRSAPLVALVKIASVATRNTRVEDGLLRGELSLPW